MSLVSILMQILFHIIHIYFFLNVLNIFSYQQAVKQFLQFTNCFSEIAKSSTVRRICCSKFTFVVKILLQSLQLILTTSLLICFVLKFSLIHRQSHNAPSILMMFHLVCLLSPFLLLIFSHYSHLFSLIQSL